jgi:hypothetical protein
VIRALEANAVDDVAERQSSPSMHAQVAPREELTAGTPHNEVLTEDSGRDRATSRELFNKSYGVPVLYQDRVIEHRNSSNEQTCCDDATLPKACPMARVMLPSHGCQRQATQ